MRLHNRVNRKELKQKIQQDSTPRITLSFYKYHFIPNPQLFRDHLYLILNEIGVMGRIYVANEGINAQVSVAEEKYDLFKDTLYSIDFLNQVRLNIAVDDNGKSFFALIIKLKDKIVADGLDDSTFDASNCGTHLKADEFNQLVEQENTIIVDMRNHYEMEVGYFKNAILPDVETFREALPVVEQILEPEKEKNIVMYCTGGIRCEKASAYYKHKGFKNVFQLEGGIIEYARRAKELGIENKFVGKNFVFDERLGERISDDVVAKCHQCGTPCDEHKNCANDACHLLFIQCPTCAEKFVSCCSVKCKTFNELPEQERMEKRKTEQFNGTKFGKGRYKAQHKDQKLDV